MKITIIPVDSTVYKDGVSFSDLDLSAAPTNVHALQFNTESNKGWIEFIDNDDGTKPQNRPITELPDWAVTACAKWDDAKSAYDAAVVEAAANQPITNGTQPA